MPDQRSALEQFVDRFLATRRFEEAVVLMFCGLLMAIAIPVAVARAFAGQWLIVAFDAGVVAAAGALTAYLWRSRRADIAGAIGAGLCALTLVAIVYLFDVEMLYWAYPATTAVYFLLRPGRAAQLNVVVVAVIAPQTLALGPWVDVMTFLVTLLTSNVLALIFAASMSHSRSRLRVLAERDPLTGFGNRHAFEIALADALDKRRERSVPVSLLLADLDRFKRVNDTWGHEVGDRVLVEVTRALESGIRAGDDVFRYGGEELVVLANGAPLGPAGQLAEKLRQRVEAHEVAGVGHITVSFGVAEAHPTDTPESWFRRADEMLYRAKRDGRNRVRVDEGPQLPLGIPEE